MQTSSRNCAFHTRYDQGRPCLGLFWAVTRSSWADYLEREERMASSTYRSFQPILTPIALSRRSLCIYTPADAHRYSVTSIEP
jgi:hypothetical protein